MDKTEKASAKKRFKTKVAFVSCLIDGAGVGGRSERHTERAMQRNGQDGKEEEKKRIRRKREKEN